MYVGYSFFSSEIGQLKVVLKSIGFTYHIYIFLCDRLKYNVMKIYIYVNFSFFSYIG